MISSLNCRTSESVSEGHPDKICDRISDAIVDLYLKHDENARVAVETMVTTNRVILAGEVKSCCDFDDQAIEECVRGVIRSIGYEQEGFHWQNVVIESYVHDQSADISRGVDGHQGGVIGAGDQGIMFGYATDETPEYMPAPIFYAHRILRAMAQDRHCGKRNEFGPDSKCQVSLKYDGDYPVGVESVVVSTQHQENVCHEQVIELVKPYIYGAFPEDLSIDTSSFYINPTGRFVIGGPQGDAGLTGRKIIVDTYGGAAPHGGGAFSGKDASKVDRSAAYMARYLSKNVVAAGLAKRCTIDLSYAIGVPDPLSLRLDLHETARVDEVVLGKLLSEVVDLTPLGICHHLGLNRPIYERTAAYGHFGRQVDEDGGFSWERVDLLKILQAEF